MGKEAKESDIAIRNIRKAIKDSMRGSDIEKHELDEYLDSVDVLVDIFESFHKDMNLFILWDALGVKKDRTNFEDCLYNMCSMFIYPRTMNLKPKRINLKSMGVN